MYCDDVAVMDDAKDAGQPRPDLASARTFGPTVPPPSPVTKTRSLSDGGNSTPGRSLLSPSPLLLGLSTRPTCKDDSTIGSSSTDAIPMTPRRAAPSFQKRSMAFQLPNDGMQPSQPQQRQQQQQQQHKEQELQPPSTPISASSGAFLLHQQLQQQQQQQQQFYHNQPAYMAKPAPLSPKLDPSQIYASPTNIVPRRSRGLDFSRAATSLHHSTLAEQSSPDLSPVAGGGGGGGQGAMNIPGRKPGDYGGAPESSTSLWSMMGRSQDKVYPSSSLGSVNIAACSDSSSSEDEDEDMDEDTDEPFITTPQVGKTSSTHVAGPQTTMPWMPSSPAMNSLLSFTHRQRPRKQPKRKVRGPLGLGFSSIIPSAASANAGSSADNVSRSPPSGFLLGRDTQSLQQQPHPRRESISWAANQLHISGSESDDNLKAQMDPGEALGPQRGVVRRAVTRRGNLLPKTKGFARIRAALAEESAPAEADFRREAEVVRLLESDMEPADRLPLPPPLRSMTTTANSSPSMVDSLDDLADDVMAMDASTGLGLSGGFGKPQPQANTKATNTNTNGVGRPFWSRLTQPSTGSLAHVRATTPPPLPPPQLRSYSTSSIPDDASMDSPIASCASASGGGGGNLVFPQGGIFPMTTSSSGGETPQPGQVISSSGGVGGGSQQMSNLSQQAQQPVLPSAAEITRRINSKRRRDDDLDPVSFKRRAVSPGMSVHNSPVMQSPLQRDTLPWGGPGMGTPSTASRPGSGSGGIGSIGLFEVRSSSADNSSTTSNNNGSGSGNGSGSSNNNSNNNSNTNRRIAPSTKTRVNFQAMADTNDSITRLSIE
ncbi:hypothetical protein SCUCBS95973_000346 [Sporothrix curviconia]|uniref:Uncharacterized protein n=1 Tax=Sporothrix curviconia TaxID=1260050 RepID=A0ABP0APF4_9PEZI